MNTEEKNLLQTAVSEIRGLRRQNEIMGARLQMFDDMMLVFKTEPRHPSVGQTEDICWKIEKHIEKYNQ